MKNIFWTIILLAFLPNLAHAKEPAGEDFFYKKTFDLGLATGSTNSFSYTEVDLALNLYVNPFIDFRNALFGRFISGSDNIFGLDSSVRGVLNADLEVVGMTAFAGPGIRFPSRGGVAPFAEAGVVFRILGISLGGGAKRIFNSAFSSSGPDETQYFLILAGGGSL
jgi:hypothetical protein